MYVFFNCLNSRGGLKKRNEPTSLQFGSVLLLEMDVISKYNSTWEREEVPVIKRPRYVTIKSQDSWTKSVHVTSHLFGRNVTLRALRGARAPRILDKISAGVPCPTRTGLRKKIVHCPRSLDELTEIAQYLEGTWFTQNRNVRKTAGSVVVHPLRIHYF